MGRRTFPSWTVMCAGGVSFLRDQGSSRIVLIGASVGGTAVLKVASSEELAGVAALSAPARIESFQVTPQELGRIRTSKLFLAAEDDEGGAYLRTAQAFFDASAHPKELHRLTGNAHGTDL